MLTVLVALNAGCLAGVAALWVWSRRQSVPADGAVRFAAVLDTAQRHALDRRGEGGGEACS
jgi:hypothetical protein